MPTWDKLDEQNKNIKMESWSLYWSEFKSGTSEFEEFLHNPLKVLSQSIDEIDSSWTVYTNILNHEVGLQKDEVCSLCMTDQKKKIAYMTFFKHPIG